MRHDDRGAAAVETAVLATFLVLLLFGIVDVGTGIFNRLAIEDAAQAGAAYGSLTEGALVSQIEAVTRGSVDSPNLTDVATTAVTVTCLEDTKGPNRATRFISVDVTYDMPLITPLASIFSGPIRLSASSTSEVFTGALPSDCPSVIPIP